MIFPLLEVVLVVRLRWAMNSSNLVEKRTKIPVRTGYGLTENHMHGKYGTTQQFEARLRREIASEYVGQAVDGELWVKGQIS